jgi:hypothetical protein
VAAASSLSRGAAAHAGGAAVGAARGLLAFSVQVLLALGLTSDDSLVRLLGGIDITPWNLRSLLWAVVVGAAAAAFLPALLRGLSGSDVSLRHALIVGTLAALAGLVMLDLVGNDPARLGSAEWRLAVALVPPLAAGVLAELSTR